MIDKATAFLKNNVDTKTVVSGVVVAMLVGAGVYFASRSGIKPLQEAAKIVNGGK